MMNDIFTISKSQPYSCWILIVILSYFSENLEHLFLIFLRNPDSGVFNSKFNYILKWVLLFLNLIRFFNQFSLNLNFDASYRSMLDRFWYEYKKCILNFLWIANNWLRNIFININAELQPFQFRFHHTCIYQSLNIISKIKFL